jgi:ditrans,polycis-polyprenyl diphosphate synthase
MVSWYERFFMRVIDSGEVPEHIAIIMDGNRRYAKKRGYASPVDGHQEGAQKLKEVIQWLSLLHGVKMLTVYAFSILNFKRSPEEVEGLMQLALDTFEEVLKEEGRFQRDNCAIRFLGRRELLNQEVRELFEKVEKCAPANPQFVLNICASYTSHDEIERARDQCRAEGAELTLSEVFARLDLPLKPDLLIRTSGVNRMSNFLLLQCAETPIAIVESLWPELTLFELGKILVRYQLRKSLPCAI